jgi:hypothetical protein
MRRHSAIASVLALVLVLASASGVLARAPDVERPWWGHADGQAWFDETNPKDCPAGITTRVEEHAIASHLGSSHISMSHCPTGNPAFSFGRAGIALIAANGDAVFGSYVGTTEQYEEVIGAEGIQLVYITVTGGTGRFESATGSAVMEVHFIFEGYDDLSWPWWATWEGTLSY